MLEQLHIYNFKCFENTSLPLKPLTLLTGFNATGKSTTLQAILLLTQTLRRDTNLFEIPLNGSLIRLGYPSDIFHNGQSSALTLGMETNKFKGTFTLGAIDRKNVSTLSLINFEHTDLTTNSESPIEKTGITYKDTETSIFSSLSNVIYISILRIGTLDVYPAPDEPNITYADVGTQGEFATWWFEQNLDEEIDISRKHASESNLSLRKQFNAWAGDLFPNIEANAIRIPDTNLVKLQFRNHESDQWRRPANIGYGLSYTFPILIAALLAKKGQIIIIDSPEAHLHPMGQSKMGEFLAKIASSGVQIIVETHSDHVLNGVRLAVHRKCIPPDQTAIHFFNAIPRSSSDAAHITSPILDANGNLDEWPAGFFDQAENDLSILAGWGTR